MRAAVDAAGGFLTGVRVLELADELGEYCGKVLAGLGADVVKIEPPGGELTRTYGPFDHDRPERSLYFEHFNFGKRGIVLDLGAEAGREAFLKLVESADIVLDARPRGYLTERGLDYATMKRRNPGVVHARISAFGDDGPWADYKGCDLVHLALGGVMMNCGYDPTPSGDYDTPPIAPQMWHAYQIAGEVTALEVIAALCYRLETEVGQQLSTSVHDAVAKNTESDVPDWIYRRSPHARLTCRHSFPTSGAGGAASLPATPGLARTKDGRWMLPYMTYLGGGSGPSPTVTGLKRLLAEHGLGGELDGDEFQDPAYFRKLAGVRRVNATVAGLIGAYKADRDLWRDAQAHGLPWAPVRRPEENLADPHWAERETFFEIENTTTGRTEFHVGAKWYSPGLPWRRGPAAPRLGEHTATVLAENRAARSPARAAPGPRRKIAGAERSKLGKPWALGGVRVLDLGWILASAGGGRFLAALGAEVIKVEHRDRLDLMRFGSAMVPDGLRPARDAAQAPLPPPKSDSLNRGGSFMEINTGKRAISLNLKAERGKALFTRLLKEADVLVEGFSPGVLERMGFSWETLRAINPRLVYVQQSGMGQRGLYETLKSFGPTAQAMSGISDMSGLPEPYAPAGIGYSYLDWFGAYQIALAMMAGLYRQKTTGEGCWIDSSQTETGIYLSGTAVLNHSVNGQRWERYGNRSPYKPAAPHGAYPVRGRDRWIALAAFTDQEWRALAKVLGRKEWLSDPSFATLELRLANQERLDAMVAGACREQAGVALMEALQAAGVPAGICETAEDRCDWDPQLAHLEWLMELRQTEMGLWRTKTPPTRFSETPPYQGGLVDRHGPCYGEDNAYVYGEILGLGEAEIEELARDGVI